MKINFSRTEYRTLLEAFEIVSWVLRAHRHDLDPEGSEYRELEQKIFSYAEEFGRDDLVLWDKELKQYIPTISCEESSRAMRFLKEFENDTFWDELLRRLVERDFVRQQGEDKAFSMTIKERIEKENPLRRKYLDEFETNGLENINLKNSN